MDVKNAKLETHLGIDPINIERAILSTFLDLNETGYDEKDLYKLDERAFSTKLHKRIAERINEVKDGAYGFLCYTIEESVAKTALADEFLWIISQNSLQLSHSKRYHDRILARVTKGSIL